MSSRRNLIGLLVPMLALAFAFALPGAATAAGTASIAGTVTAEDGGDPLESVSVCAYSGDEEGSFEELCDLTDEEGEYLIPEVGAGAYVVEFWAGSESGYLGEWYDGIQFYTEEPLDEVEVEEGEAVTGVDATLIAASEISGTVTAAVGGAPIEGIEVCAWGETGGGYWPCTHTDEDGEYSIGGLPASEYKVEFWVPRPLTYVREYYDDQLRWEDAEPVPVGVGEVVEEIDAGLAQGGQISGRVTAAASGTPLSEVLVCGYESLDVLYNCTETSAGGFYSLTRFPTDGYKVSFSEDSVFEGEVVDDGYLTQFYKGATSLAAATPLALLAPNAITGIDAALVSTLPAPPGGQAPPVLTPPAAKKVFKTKKCRKGTKRKHVKGKPGKTRCVKVHKKGKSKKRGKGARPPISFDLGRVRLHS